MHKEEYRTVRVNGTASVSKTPDTATITLTVERVAQTQSLSTEAQAEFMNAVLVALSDVDPAKIKTQYYYTSQNYTWDGKKQKKNGFTTTQRLSAVTSIEVAPKVISALADLSVPTQVSMSLKDTAGEELKVLTLAVEDATTKAQALAKACGCVTGLVLACDSTDSGGPRYAYKMMACAPSGGGAAESVAPALPEGEIELHANVNMVFQLTEI